MRTIAVKGVGSISAKPDYITITMAIETLSKDYGKAMTEASERIEKLQQAAVGSGLEKEALKTTSFNVNTRYESIKNQQGNYLRQFAGYACSYHLKLAFDFDSKRLADVVSAIAGSGARPELHIAFTVKNPTKIREELLASAAENARTRAEILCRASGSQLGPLLSVNYNWGETDFVSRTTYEVEDSVQPLMAASRCCAPEIQPDEIDVSDTAAFVWEIK